MHYRRRTLLIAVPMLLCILIGLLLLNTRKQDTVPEQTIVAEQTASATIQQAAITAMPVRKPAATTAPVPAAPVQPVAPVPYTGMYESSIGSTGLGSPTRKEFQESKFGGGRLGYYYWDQNGKCVFIARTEGGKVTSVTDMGAVRKNAEKIREQPGEDPYHANEYSNEEDFWDEHRDDFMDYYAAEEYWREHQ